MKKKIKAKVKGHKRSNPIAKNKPRRTKKTIRLVHKPARSKKAAKTLPATKKVVRIMGHGQFTIDSRTLKRLNEIDSVLVEIVASEKADDAEFKKNLAELNQIAIKHGKAVDPREIVRSDIVLPSADLPVDEAKKLFTGEGVIPEN